MKGISVYLLDEKSRAELLRKFPPMFPTVVGHHTTYKFGASDEEPLPPAGVYSVVGYTYEKERKMNGSGIEALVVAINGKTARPDGSVYHITWSHGPGFAPKDSNRLLKQGWGDVKPIIEIDMEPTFIPFNR